MREAEFQAAVIELAELQGWRCYHTHDSRRSQPGYPDLTLCRPPRLIFAECKTDTGRTSDDQDAWLDVLNHVQNAVPEHVLVAVWRPCMWRDIEQALKR